MEGGGGVRKENGGKKMESIKCLFCKAILYINIDKTHFNYKIVKK